MAVKKAKVRGEGEAKGVPARVPERVIGRDAATCWLERTNPLIGLSIRTAQNIFDCARAGDTQKLHWIFQEIEASNPVLMTCIERRSAAIANFQWNVTPRPEADQTLAEEQQDAVRALVSGIRNFTELLEHLDSSFFRGFALAQPIWEDDGFVREIALHNSWEFVRHDGILYHCPECNGWTPGCVDCTDARLIGVERRRAIDYPALSIHIRHAVGTRDWGRFLERYALPKPAVTMAPNATNAQRDDYLVAARAVENGQVSVWPSGANIIDFAGGSRGTDPFRTFIEKQEELMVLMATGGTLTSLAQADTGSLAGGAQMEVWKEILSRDAGVLSQAIMRSVVIPFLADKFFGRPAAVDFSLDIPRKLSPRESADVAAVLKSAGYRVDQTELEKAVGFTLIKEDPQPAQPQGFAMARAKASGSRQLSDGSVITSGADALADAFATMIAETMAEELLKKGE